MCIRDSCTSATAAEADADPASSAASSPMRRYPRGGRKTALLMGSALGPQRFRHWGVSEGRPASSMASWRLDARRAEGKQKSQ
eukprot:6381534-Pyramimonas_sp.AAC.1